MKINTNNINKQAKKLKDNINDLKSELAKLKIIKQDIEDSWKGERASKYIEALDLYISELEQLIKNLNKYYDYISNIPKTYEIFDDIFANKKIKV